MSAKDDKIAELEYKLGETQYLVDSKDAEIAGLRESLTNCQQENVRLLENYREAERLMDEAAGRQASMMADEAVVKARADGLQKRVDILQAALEFADARINRMMEENGTKMTVTNNYHIGKTQ